MLNVECCPLPRLLPYGLVSCAGQLRWPQLLVTPTVIWDEQPALSSYAAELHCW